MRKTMGIVLAGGRVEELSVLTARRPKSAVLFGGIYRTIDFALTNLANAGIGQVGILTQYRPSPLMDHVGSGLAWDLVGAAREVRFLPPYLGSESDDWYRGPADALYQNLDFIERLAPDDVLAVSGDHVYSMDYGPLLSYHHEKGADLTMVFAPVADNASRFGIGELNAAGQIVGFTEKPEYPRTELASMSVYVFRREVLVEELLRAVRGVEGDATFQIHEVLRRMMPRRRAYGYVYHGSWAYTRTLDEYDAFHRDLLGPSPKIDLSSWRVRTNLVARRTEPPPPVRCAPGSVVENSLVANGCVITGTVRNSVLSPGVRVGPGAVVTDSILWDDVVVEAGATAHHVICDKRVRIGANAQIGVGELAPSRELPRSLTCGATVIGVDVRIPPGARLGKSCIVHPDAGESAFAAPLPSGESVRPPRREREARR